MVAPLAVRMGKSFSAAMVLGEPFIWTLYSVGPIFTDPAGRARFCELMALITSTGDSPFYLQRGNIHVDGNLTLLSAIRPGNGRARHGRQLVAHEISAVVEQLLLGHSLALESQVHDRNVEA